MSEKPVFFPSLEQNLFGVLHLPENTARTGFVFCHPFVEEKLWAHRVFVSFARELTERGIAVFRFDNLGHGDSDGEFEEATIQSNLANINDAIDWFKSECPDLNCIGLIGLRLGATYASLVARQRSDIDKLIMWEPIVDGSRYMKEVLRTNLTTQLAVYGKVTEKREDLVNKMRAGSTVNIEGYELTLAMFDGICAIDLCTAGEVSIDTLIVQFARKGQSARPDIVTLSGLYPNSTVELVEEEPFWKEIKRYYGRAQNLFSASLSWIEGWR